VFNGLAFDRDGEIVVNETDDSAQRSVTLASTNATYYVEVEFVTSEGDVDSRAFWDPTYDNGLDTSGDVIPDGREFSENVATRLIPDWNIVSPISTTSFSFSTDNNSVKIPVAIVTVSGGAISIGTKPARACLKQAVSIGGSFVPLLDSRLFPNSGNITVGEGLGTSETVTIASNDRKNNVLNLTGTLANNHGIGERVVDISGSPNSYISERTSHNPLLPTTAGDARPLFWQGNSELGYGLSQDPYAATGNSDVQVKNLKEYVDFLAAQVRQLKWGSAKDSEVGNVAPPTTFPATPKYYDNVGGVQGARAHTVSVGNGTTTFGDFNGTTGVPIQAAIDSLPAEGGIVYLKKGTYAIATPITLTTPVTLVGDGTGATIIRTDSATAGIVLAAAGAASSQIAIILKDIAFTLGAGGASHSVESTSGDVVVATQCVFEGFATSGSGVVDQSSFYSCVFSSLAGLGSGLAFSGKVTTTNFIGCKFVCSFVSASSRALTLASFSTNVGFKECVFDISAATGATNVVNLAGVSLVDLTFSGCKFVGISGTSTVFQTTNGSNVTIRDCASNTGLGTVTNYSNWVVDHCSMTIGATGKFGIKFDTACVDCHVLNSSITQSATAGTASIGIDAVSVSDLFITDTKFVDCDVGVRLGTVTRFSISGCLLKCQAGRGQQGIIDTASLVIRDGSISGCHFDLLGDDAATLIAGINLSNNTTATKTSVDIRGCSFVDVGNGVSGGDTYGIKVASIVSLSIMGCSFKRIQMTSGTSVHGVHMRNCTRASVLSNTFDTVGSGAASSWTGIFADSVTQTSISNNEMDALGSSSAAVDNNAFIKVQNDGAGSASDQISIIGNNLNGVLNDASFKCYGILLLSGVSRASVASNNVSVGPLITGTVLEAGVRAESGSEVVESLAVTGNTVVATDSTYLNNGISVFFTGVGTTEGRLVISGNVVSKAKVAGIVVEGPAAGNSFSSVISSNTVQSNAAATTGIKIKDVSIVSISSNSIYLTGTGLTKAIDASSASPTNDIVSITGNSITSTSGSAEGIVAVLVDQCSISGNVVDLNSSGPCLSVGSSLRSFVSGNYTRNIGAGAAIFGTTATTAFSKARKDSDTDGSPTSDTDMGLNLRLKS